MVYPDIDHEAIRKGYHERFHQIMNRLEITAGHKPLSVGSFIDAVADYRDLLTDAQRYFDGDLRSELEGYANQARGALRIFGMKLNNLQRKRNKKR